MRASSQRIVLMNVCIEIVGRGSLRLELQRVLLMVLLDIILPLIVILVIVSFGNKRLAIMI